MYLLQKMAPEETPVTLAEAKQHLRASNSRHESTITALIAVATDMLDGPSGYLRRAIITQTWTLYRRTFPAHQAQCLSLPAPPLQSVTSVKYYDADGVLTTLDSSVYHVVITAGGAGWLELQDGQSWPINTAVRPDAVQVEFVAGYGDAALVPAPIKHAMLLLIGELFENRGDGYEGASPIALAPGLELVSPNTAAVRNLLARYIWREMA